MRVLSVSQINFFIKSLIEGDGRMRDIYARGEISNFEGGYVFVCRAAAAFLPERGHARYRARACGRV